MRLLKDKRRQLFLSLLVAFVFRLIYGLCSQFRDEDAKQIYLIGLKFYTTGGWPYFGPDVTQTIQIPGALQGLLVGLPFFVLPIPEAPYILLNLLSFASLCFFAWYCSRRLPELPNWFTWFWLLTAPWTLNLSTHIINPSYVLPGAILFFVGAIETLPFLTRGLVLKSICFFCMGLGLTWIMQLHLSWVVLIPYVVVSLYYAGRNSLREGLRSLVLFIAGALIPAVLLIPTFVKYGFGAALGSTNETVQFTFANIARNLNIVEGVLGRFLSFASFEVPRFIGTHTADRLNFLRQNWWLIPFVAFLTVAGILQAIMMVILWFRKQHSQQDWKAIKYFTLVTVSLLYVSFLFSTKAPVSHTFYLTLPVAMLYSLYCWSEFLKRRAWQTFAKVFLACGIVFHVGLAIHNFSTVSIYTERTRIVEALKSKDYHLVGERRPQARY